MRFSGFFRFLFLFLLLVGDSACAFSLVTCLKGMISLSRSPTPKPSLNLEEYVAPGAVRSELMSHANVDGKPKEAFTKAVLHWVDKLPSDPQSRRQQAEERIELRERIMASHRVRQEEHSLSVTEAQRLAALEILTGKLSDNEAARRNEPKDIFHGVILNQGELLDSYVTGIRINGGQPSESVKLSLKMLALMGIEPSTRARAHMILTELGITDHLRIMLTKRLIDDFKLSGLGENRLVDEIQRWNDGFFSSWVKTGEYRLLNKESQARVFNGRDTHLIHTFLEHDAPEVRANAARSLRRNYSVSTVPALRRLVNRELEADRFDTDVLLAVVDALRRRNEGDSLQLLQQINIEVTRRRHFDHDPNACDRIAGRANEVFLESSKAWKIVNGEIGSGYDVRPIQIQAEEVANALNPHRALQWDADENRSPDKAIPLAACSLLPFLPLTVANSSGGVARPFERALGSPHVEVREMAMRALQGRTDPEARAFAIEILERPHEFTSVSVLALEALSKMNHIESTAAIERATRSKNETVRRAALGRNPLAREFKLGVASNGYLKTARYDAPGLSAKHRGLLSVADLAYEYPEADLYPTGKALTEALERFKRLLPLGQKLVHGGSDSYSGFKVFVTESYNESGVKVLTVGVAGTQGLTDMITDGRHGVDQIVGELFNKTKAFLVNGMREGAQIDISAHSLGGVAATSLAYKLEAARGTSTEFGPVEVVTWNGLGAVEALSRQGDYRPAIAARVVTTNYRAKGDIVSLVGTHIGGQTVTLPGTNLGVWGNIKEALSFQPHLLTNVAPEANLMPSDAIPEPGHKWVWRPLGLLSYTLGWGPKILLNAKYKWSEKRYLTAFRDAARMWAENHTSVDGDNSFQPFLIEASSVAARMRPEDSSAAEGWSERLSRQLRLGAAIERGRYLILNPVNLAPPAPAGSGM